MALTYPNMALNAILTVLDGIDDGILVPTPEEQEDLAARQKALDLAHEISGIVNGNEGLIDPDHDVQTCEVCNQVADKIPAFAAGRACLAGSAQQVNLPLRTQFSLHEITETMLQFGGSFVQQLARLIRCADHENTKKLALAFLTARQAAQERPPALRLEHGLQVDRQSLLGRLQALDDAADVALDHALRVSRKLWEILMPL